MKLGASRSRCSECGEHFNSAFAFDKHRKGDYGNPGEKPGTGRFCLSEFGMEALGMVKNDSGFWITSKMSQETLEREMGRRAMTLP